jgi:hypothetical protein
MDDLRYTGSAGSCAVQFSQGSACPGEPMRVCAGTGPDPEGNVCNWAGCGYQQTTVPDYFGGCSGNSTAGTLCVPNGCADGTTEQTFLRGMVGCAGAVTFGESPHLCAAGYRTALATEWDQFRGSVVPTHNYWTQTPLNHYSGSAASCTASSWTGSSCPDGSPMHVCTPGGSDPEGNSCNWRNCSLDGGSGANDYLGGCWGNTTAGVLCVPYGCSDHTHEQHFGNFVVGCAGSVTWDNRASLCATGSPVLTGDLWKIYHGNLAPTHDYWLDDNLRYSGSGPNSCSASSSTGTLCPANQPMHVCTDTGADPEGNYCNWTHCGYQTNSPDQYLGGCVGNLTAGTLCYYGP